MRKQYLQDKLLIDGRFVPAISGETFSVSSPIDSSELGQVSQAGVADLDLAVKAARDTFDAGHWTGMQNVARSRLLRKIAEGIRQNAPRIAEVETRNSGKTISNSLNEVDSAANVFDYYAGAMDKFFGDTIPLGGSALNFTINEPVGVVAAITPWNFPFMAAAWKVAPALAAGCTLILKPASHTPFTALLLGEIALDAGLPPGTLNILPGPGAILGGYIATHPQIDKISFTGETATGAKIQQLAAPSVKRVSLELGGKSPNIIFSDADIEKAATQAVKASFGNAGQNCSARTRLFVERTVLDRFLEAFVTATRAIKIGNPLDPVSEMGPLISLAQWDVVDGYVRRGIAEGCKLLLGGRRPAGFDQGSYYAPTILTNATNEMSVAREEIFGPVVIVIPFVTEAEVIAMANDSQYGLSGSIWTQDIGKALRTMKALRSGTVSINSHGSASQYGYFGPFGGFKKSGIGRELGMHALRLHTEVKNVLINLES